MKYIEEIVPGDAFSHSNSLYLLTIDFKKDGSRLAYNVSNGYPKWFSADTIIDTTNLYTLDKNNTILPVKETPKNA